MNKLRFFSVLLLLAALVGCGGKNGLVSSGQSGVFIQSIALTPGNPSIALTVPPAAAATEQFVAIATPNIGNPYDITRQVMWSTADPNVASISTTGLATAAGSGRTYVGFSYTDPGSGKSFSANTILSVVPQLTGISITPPSAQIARATTQQFLAIGSFNDNTTVDITSQVSWTSSQPSAATISASPGTQGLAAGAGQGTTNISASLGQVSSNLATLAVTNANLVSLAVTPSSPTVPLAKRQQLIATGTFDDGSTQDVSRSVAWSTLKDPSAVVRLTAIGAVTGIGLGRETITAQSPSGPSASTTVTVDESSVASINALPVNMVVLQGSQSPEPVLANGTKQQMRASATFKDGSSLDVTGIEGISWTSGNASVATVDAGTGLLTTQAPGQATITAVLGSKQGSTPLKVLNAALRSLSVAPNGAMVPQGGIQNLIATATFLAPDNLTLFQQDVSNAAAWSVDANAGLSYVNNLQELATGISSGMANITASFGTPGGSPLQATTVLNVTPSELASISLVPGSAAVPTDGSQQFIATGNFTDGSQENLSLVASWGSSDPAITTISPFGFMSASGPGQTNVNASMLNPVSGSTVSGAGPVLVNPAALARLDICAATVSNPLQSCPPLDPQQPPPNPSMGNQTQFGLIAIGTFTDGSREDLTNAVHWSSATPEVAVASDDPGIPGITTGIARRGILTGNDVGGTATIKASSGPITAAATVQVDPSVLQSVAITPKHGAVGFGQSEQLKVMGTFADGSTQDITPTAQWFSLNPDIAIVTPGGLLYTTGTGLDPVLQGAGSLTISSGFVNVTMLNPSATSVFSWPIGTVVQFEGLAVSAGDVSSLNDTPFTVVAEFNPANPQQTCQPGQACIIQFAAPTVPPADGSYTVTAGTGHAAALVTATADVVQFSVLSAVSGSTTVMVQ